MRPEPTSAGRRELWRCSVHHFLNDGYSWVLYPLLPAIAAEFGLGYGGAGSIKTALNLLLSTLGLPFGLLAERIGEGMVLTLGTSIYGLGIALLGAAWSYSGFLVLLLLAGAGGGAFHPVASSLVSKVFPRHGTGTAIGILNFAGDVGKAAIPLAAGALAALVGWRAALLAAGVTGTVAALLLHRAGPTSYGAAATSRRFAPNSPPAQPTSHRAEPTSHGAEPTSPGPQLPPGGRAEAPAAKATPAATPAASGGPSLRGRDHWGVLHWPGFAALHGVGVLDSLARSGVAVFVPFLLLEKGASQASLGAYIALLAAGGAAGKLACGPLGDRLGQRRVVMATEAATSLSILAFIHVGAGWAAPVLVMLGAFLNGTSSVLYALVANVTSEARRSRGYAMYYTVTLMASAAAPVTFGLIADASGVHTALRLMAGGLLVAISLASLLREQAAHPAAGRPEPAPAGGGRGARPGT